MIQELQPGSHNRNELPDIVRDYFGGFGDSFSRRRAVKRRPRGWSPPETAPSPEAVWDNMSPEGRRAVLRCWLRKQGDNETSRRHSSELNVLTMLRNVFCNTGEGLISEVYVIKPVARYDNDGRALALNSYEETLVREYDGLLGAIEECANAYGNKSIMDENENATSYLIGETEIKIWHNTALDSQGRVVDVSAEVINIGEPITEAVSVAPAAELV